MGRKVRRSGAVRTAEDYGSQSSIHGLTYASDSSLPLPDRILWALTTLGLLLLASHLNYSTYREWREHQVVTALSTTNRPVSIIFEEEPVKMRNNVFIFMIISICCHQFADEFAWTILRLTV